MSRRNRGRLVYGRHPVASLFAHDPMGVKELWMAEGLDPRRRADVARWAEQFGVPIHAVPRGTLDRMCEGGVHQGVVARFRPTATRRKELEVTLDEVLARAAQAPLLLLLDGVEDPRNLGACLRSAAAAGGQRGSGAPEPGSSLSPEAPRSSRGAAELVPLIKVPNLARCMDWAQRTRLDLFGAVAGPPNASTTLN